MCSKKDYEAVADILLNEREKPAAQDSPYTLEVLDEIAGRLAAHFARHNPAFDADRFLRRATVD